MKRVYEQNNQRIIDIKVFNVNGNYIEFNGGYAIDGAIELKLTNKIITLGWDFDLERFEYFETPCPDLLHSFEFDVNELYQLKSLIGKKVQVINKVETVFNVVTDYYTMKTEKYSYVTGFEMFFDKNFKLKVDAVNFDTDFERNIPVNIVPDLQGLLLIDLGGRFNY